MCGWLCRCCTGGEVGVPWPGGVWLWGVCVLGVVRYVCPDGFVLVVRLVCPGGVLVVGSV